MDISTTHHARRRAVVAAMIVAGLLPGLAACGSDETGAASPSSTARDEYGSGSLKAREARWRAAVDAYDVKLAGCLREAGFDVPDPQPGQGVTQSGNGIEAAAAACRKGKLGDPPLPPKGTPKEEAEAKREGDANTAKAVRCLRDRGYDVEDPAATGGALNVPGDVTQQDLDECAGA